MASVNRYTQVTPSRFDPLSLDEILAVPMYKQQQYDKLEAANAAIKSIPVDPLKWHQDEAMALKQDFESKLDEQAMNLAKTGDFQNGKSEFLKLKRQYDDLVAPTGRIGQINNAKKVYKERFDNYMKEATETKNWSREQALNGWYRENESKYKGYDDDNNITNIDEYGSPIKVDRMQKLKDIKSILGDQVDKEMSQSGYSFATAPDGGVVMIDRKGHRVETSNRKNLNEAIKMVNAQMAPGGEWARSIQFEGVPPENVAAEMTHGINSMFSSDIVDNRTQDASYHAPDRSGGKEDEPVMDLIVNSEVYNPSAYSNNSYDSNKEELDKLSKIQNPTPEQNLKLNQLKEFQSSVDNSLKTNKEYLAEKAKIDKFYKTIPSNNVKELFKRRIYESASWFPVKNDDGTYSVVGDVAAKGPIEGGDGKVLKFTKAQIEQFKDKIDDFPRFRGLEQARDKVVKENNVKYNGYQLIPTDAKEDTSLRLMNESFEEAMRANPKNLLNFTNIESVDVDGKRKDDISNNDRLGIQELFNATERGSARIVSFIPKGFSGKPEYVVEFNTKEGNKYNLDGIKWGNDDLGDGKPVRVKLSFTKSAGDVLKNVNGYVQSYLSTKGKNGEGMQLAQSMAMNAKRADLAGMTWRQLVPSPHLDDITDPVIADRLGKELKKYGFNANTTEAEAEKMIAKLLADKKNTRVYFEE